MKIKDTDTDKERIIITRKWLERMVEIKEEIIFAAFDYELDDKLVLFINHLAKIEHLLKMRPSQTKKIIK